jgi:hypothetical protein
LSLTYQVWRSEFWTVETQRALVRSVSVGGCEGSSSGEGGRPKTPWRGWRWVGVRRRFSWGLGSVVPPGLCRGMPSLMARWVSGGFLGGESSRRMVVQRRSFCAGVMADSRAGHGAAVKLPLGRSTMGS